MRWTSEIDPAMVQALLDGLGFIELTHEGYYPAFVAQYLMREPKGDHGRVFYKRYAALGGDLTYIRGQLHVSRVVLGEFLTHSNSREMVVDSDDEDPDGLQEVPLTSDKDGGGGGGGVDSAPTARDPPMFEQPIPGGLQASMEPTTEGLQRPVKPLVLLGVTPEVEGEAGGIFSERSWATANFVYDEFGRTPPIAAASPSRDVLPLRERHPLLTR